ncbi:hypothetical protein Cgig2_000555 [Carnegiea gigantea]|uniref:Uncharacterized protein n=1 Tax=Carnegiea gigantea TaxID=171969 RepID=A0A9Q1GTQ1_9CARY|nr:hypothetical protein Cgig2_000555 [Carnegiea gigantea]
MDMTQEDLLNKESRGMSLIKKFGSYKGPVKSDQIRDMAHPRAIPCMINVEGVTSKVIMLDERRKGPCASSASRRGWLVKGASPLLVSQEAFSSATNMVATSHGLLFRDNSFAEEGNVTFHGRCNIKDVIMNGYDSRRLAKQLRNEIGAVTFNDDLPVAQLSSSCHC